MLISCLYVGNLCYRNTANDISKFIPFAVAFLRHLTLKRDSELSKQESGWLGGGGPGSGGGGGAVKKKITRPPDVQGKIIRWSIYGTLGY